MLNAIIWMKGSDYILSEILPEKYHSSVCCYLAENYSVLTEMLVAKRDIDVLIAILSPTDIEALYQISQIQDSFPKLSVVAIFDTSAKSAIEQALNIVVGDAKNEPSELEVVDKPKPTDLSELALEDFNSAGRCHLTPRQRDVLQMIMSGQSNKEIARSLGLSEGTVKVHCMAIFKELDVSNRTQAAIRAEQYMQSA